MIDLDGFKRHQRPSRPRRRRPGAQGRRDRAEAGRAHQRHRGPLRRRRVRGADAGHRRGRGQGRRRTDRRRESEVAPRAERRRRGTSSARRRAWPLPARRALSAAVAPRPPMRPCTRSSVPAAATSARRNRTPGQQEASHYLRSRGGSSDGWLARRTCTWWHAAGRQVSATKVFPRDQRQDLRAVPARAGEVVVPRLARTADLHAVACNREASQRDGSFRTEQPRDLRTVTAGGEARDPDDSLFPAARLAVQAAAVVGCQRPLGLQLRVGWPAAARGLASGAG